MCQDFMSWATILDMFIIVQRVHLIGRFCRLDRASLRVVFVLLFLFVLLAHFVYFLFTLGSFSGVFFF